VRVGLGEFLILEMKIVFVSLLIIEFRSGDIHTDLHDVLMPSGFDGIGEELKSLFSVIDSRSESSLITDVSSVEAVFLLDVFH
jgi:hypothetical protein